MAPILLCLWMVSRLKLMKKKMDSEDDINAIWFFDMYIKDNSPSETWF